MKRDRNTALLVFVVTLLFVASSFVTPFAGFAPDAFPIPQDNPPAQPAGYAFSIWGVIYVWLIVSAAYGLWKRSDDPAWAPARLPLILSLGVGMFWLAVAAQSPIWATLMIWTMLVFAIWAMVRTPQTDHWLFRGPVALYAGWLTAASSVSLGLVGAGWGIGPDSHGWAFIVASIATLLSLVVLTLVPAIAEFGIAVAWALVAIAAKSAVDATGLALVAGLCAMAVGAWALIRATRSPSEAE